MRDADGTGDAGCEKMLDEAREKLEAALEVLVAALIEETAGADVADETSPVAGTRTQGQDGKSKQPRERIHRVSGSGGEQRLQARIAKVHQGLALLYDNALRNSPGPGDGGKKMRRAAAGESAPRRRMLGEAWGGGGWVLDRGRWLDIVRRFEGLGEDNAAAIVACGAAPEDGPGFTNFSRTWTSYLDKERVCACHCMLCLYIFICICISLSRSLPPSLPSSLAPSLPRSLSLRGPSTHAHPRFCLDNPQLCHRLPLPMT